MSCTVADRPSPDWMREANCAGTDADTFFPEKGCSADQALDICRRCPVAAECLDYALERRERFGVWGGMSAHARGRLIGDDTGEAEDVDELCGTYPSGYNRHRARGDHPCLGCRLAYNAYQRARAAARAAAHHHTERTAS